MTGLLVRMEVSPRESAFLQVPLDHVLKVMFAHGLDSELSIYNDEGRMGTLSLRPRTAMVDQSRTLNFDGNLWLQLPGLERQRYHLEGTSLMTHEFALRQLLLKFSMTVPAYEMEMRVDESRTLQYKLKQDGRLAEAKTIPLDDNAPAVIMAALNLDFDPALLKQTQSSVNPPTIFAQENQLHLRGESVEVYELIVKEGDLEVANVFVSQLGQILMAKTAFGYTLRAVDIEP